MSVFKAGLFAGKVALVTGGGTGIGRCIAQELSALGCNVVIASRRKDVLEKTAEVLNQRRALEQKSGEPVGLVEPLQCNIRKEEEIHSLVDNTVDKFGRLDFLVNNAGGQFPSPAQNISTKGWNAVIDTNLNGIFMLTKRVFEVWMEDNGGAVVNIIADIWRGFPGMVHTGAARAAVDNMTKTLSVEWAYRGVRVNSVAPGVIDSSGLETYSTPDSLKRIAIQNCPSKRLGTEEEVSAAAVFLLSPAASYITGETMRVDGASSLWGASWDVPDHNSMPTYTWQGKSKL